MTKRYECRLGRTAWTDVQQLYRAGAFSSVLYIDRLSVLTSGIHHVVFVLSFADTDLAVS